MRTVTPVRLAAYATIAFNLFFAAFLIVRPVSLPGIVTVDDWAQFVGPALVFAFFLVHVWWDRKTNVPRARAGERLLRLAPLLLALGPLLFACGQAVWTYYELVIHKPPFPSWADAGFLSTYPCLLLGILFLHQAALATRVRIRVTLDALLFMSALFAFSWYFVLGPTILQSGETFFAKAVGTAYPAFDLILVYCLLLLWARSAPGDRKGVIATLSGGLVLIVIMDSLFDYENLHNAYATGSLQDVGWTAGYMLIGLAAMMARQRQHSAADLHRDRPSEEPPAGLAETPSILRSLLPYILVPGVFGLVVYSHFTAGRATLDPGLYAGVALTVMLLLLRQVLAIAENARLTLRLQQQLGITAAITRSLGDGLVALDRNHQITFANPAAERLLGYEAADLVHRSLHDFTELPPGWLDARQPSSMDGTMRRESGETFPASLTVAPIQADGVPAGHVLGFQDVTFRKQAEEAIRASEERYRSVIETSHDSIILSDLDGRVTYANARAAAVFGYEVPEDMVGIDAFQLVAPRDRKRAAVQSEEILLGRSIEQAEFLLQTRNGKAFHAEVSSAVIRDRHGEPVGITTAARDVTDRKAHEEQLRNQALHDGLTGLPNRILLKDRLEQALLSSRQRSEQIGLLLMDLDGFKEVNDTFGHHYGDALLLQVGQRVQHILQESDTIARLGGDEFAVVLPLTNIAGAEQVARKIQSVLREPFMVEDRSLHVEGSIGIAMYPEHGADSSILLRHADVAMYAAKRGRSGHMVYDPEFDHHSPGRLSLVGDLTRAIHNDELFLHFQPKIDLQTGACDWVEALVRWQHPRRGIIPPAQFIPLAEQSGLIKSIAVWVLNTALQQVRDWQDAGLQVGVAVNLSAANLDDPHLIGEIVQMLNENGVPPASLQVEITESTLMADPEHAMSALRSLHAVGVQVAIDDFGTGYSSLAYLRRLPADELKIDRSFVMDMASNPDDVSIIRSVSDLAHNLGLRVTAEGVESGEAQRMLTDINCDMAQGFHIGVPMSADALRSWFMGSRDERMIG